MAPLSDASVARLLDRLLPAKGRLLDLGCGQGEWIHRALSVRDGVTAVGVDLHVGSGVGDLAPAQAARATVVEADAATWTGGLFDAVLAQWALEPGHDPADRDQARQASRAHREAWLTGYRGVLGFATLVLVDNPASP